MKFANPTQKEFVEDRILKKLSRLSDLFRKFCMLQEISNPDDIDDAQEIAEFQDSFFRESKDLERAVSMYLEEIGHLGALSDFKAFTKTCFDNANILLEESNNYDSEDHISVFVTEVYNFLAPYEFTQRAYTDLLFQNKGLEYLDRILRNTQVIIEHEQKKPKSEPQVYNAVKFYLTTVIPSAKEPTAVFKKQFNSYAPDIVLPELASAVEYKFVKSSKAIASIMSGILSDTLSYTGNIEYRFFYAVFYLTGAFISIDELEQLWSSYNIPVNWQPIFIIGVDYSSPVKVKKTGIGRTPRKAGK